MYKSYHIDMEVDSQDLTSDSESDDLDGEEHRNEMNAEQVCEECTGVNKQ